MKKTSVISAFASLLAIAAGCSKETPMEVIPAEPETVSTLTVSARHGEAPVSADTKVAYGTTDATWETGDKIFLIKSDGTTIALTLSDGAGTSEGTFSSTDPVVAGNYTPYAVSGSALTKGFVSVSDGSITLNLNEPGGATLADAMEHDILKGSAVSLVSGQEHADITGLTTHMLSYIRIKFNNPSEAIASIGLNSAGGIYKTVTISANGTVAGSESTTETILVDAAGDAANGYTGYLAVYDKTTANLYAHAVDANNKAFARCVSSHDADYDAGVVYGKSFTITDAQAASAASGTLSGHTWIDMGLSVRWSDRNYGASSPYEYNRNVDERGAYSNDQNGWPEWAGWRSPTREEIYELYYGCSKTWVEGSINGINFTNGENTIFMGAGGYERYRDDGYDWNYSIDSAVIFWANEAESDTYGNTYDKRCVMNMNSVSFTSSIIENRNFTFWDYAAGRLVCEY
ncbi:MAG: hypothetical protein J6U28_07710 [Bacteroidales bacterium]|nr:hypothetical protein [Bacteroidales bacterium]